MNQTDDYLRDEYAMAFPETLDFWRNAAEGIFVVPRCNACGKVHWHPRAHCPFCHGVDLTWEKSSGKGQVYSFTVVRRKDAPYILAYVKINEGPILMTNIVETCVICWSTILLIMSCILSTENIKQMTLT